MIAEVAVSLVMSGRADLIDLGNVIVVSLVDDECLHLLFSQIIPLFSQLLLPIQSVGDVAIPFFGYLACLRRVTVMRSA